MVAAFFNTEWLEYDTSYLPGPFVSSAKRKFNSIKPYGASAKAACASQDMSIHDASTTTTPSPTPRLPHLLPLSDLILQGLLQDCLCLRTSPAQDHQTLFPQKLCSFLPHPALGPILGRRPLSLQVRRLWLRGRLPEPPAEAEQPAAAKQGEGAKASGISGR